MDNVINLELLRNPYNWAIVFLMVTIGVMGLGYVAAHYQQQ